MKESKIPKIYKIITITAFVYSGISFFFSIYNQFFYTDGTWLHGFIANGFSVLAGLMWVAILLFFKKFLKEILNYNKPSMLLNAYLIFLGITILSLVNIVYQSIKVYSSLEEGNSFNSLNSFGSASISGALLLFISNYGIILICILLGNKLRKIEIFEKKLFQILGFSFIAYGIFSFLGAISIIENDTFHFLMKALLATIIGLILRNYSKGKSLDLSIAEEIIEKPKLTNNLEKEKKELKKTKEKSIKENKVKSNLTNVEIPILNLNEVENIDSIITYYENLSKEELNRLESLISRKHEQTLSNPQKKNLVIQHIIKNKTNDHSKYLPK